MMAEDPAEAGSAGAQSFARSLKIGYLAMIRENTQKVGEAANAVMEGLDRGAVVFHCTAGKDRTGVLAAILLLRLGVDEADIIADYQVSHTYNQTGINRVISSMPQLQPYLAQAGEDSFLHSRPANIQAVLDVLNRGNIGPWLEQAGVSQARQQSFLQAMLVPGMAL